MTVLTAFRRPRSGQTVIFFALAMVVLLGALGLALDGGYDFVQRRTMQNAADLAALSGARGVWLNAGPVNGSAFAVARQNGLPDPASPPAGGSSSFACVYVDNTDAALDDCTAAVPATATGVRVTLRESHQTFVMRVLGSTTSGTGATATAHVRAFAGDAGAPFIVCAQDTKLVDGTTQSIMLGPSPGAPNYTDPNAWSVNPALTVSLPANFDPQTGQPAPNDPSRELIIHDNKVNGTTAISKCGRQQSWKGVADSSRNTALNLPSLIGQTLYYQTGDVASSRAQVNGVGGCKPNGPLSGCIIPLPVGINYPADNPSQKPIYIVAVLPFYIIQVDSNTHYGYLIDKYDLDGQNIPWQAGGAGAVVIKLTK